MRTLSAAALDLARELESGDADGAHHLNIEDADLGSLQLSVARLLANADTSHGVSPRELASAMDRPDEPNVRSALNRLGERGLAELVPGIATQRWRLTAPYRAS